MTLATTSDGSVEKYAGGYAGVGLQDIDSSDMAMPRIKILHAEGLFEDQLTNEQFPSFDAIVLVIAKQRIMWFPKIHPDAQPQCKSNDFKTGFPNVNPSIDSDGFPWADSNFTQENLVINPVNGLPSLSCANCKFTEWGKDGSRPRCGEMHTYPLLRLDEDNNVSPALMTVQGSSIKPSKAFATSFKVRGEPFFFYKSHLSLVPAKSGSVAYSIVKFSKSGGTDPEEYAGYAAQAESLYDYLTKPPRNRNEDDEAPAEMSANVNEPVVVQEAPPAIVVPPVVAAPPAPPVAAPVPIADTEVIPPVAKKSDLPF